MALSGKESACQCGRHKRYRFDLWVGKMPWSRKWQPTPVFLPGKSHGQKSLAGYHPWHHKESDTTKHTCISHSHHYIKCFRCYSTQGNQPDHLTCLLRNLYAGQEATVRTGRGTTDWFQIGKGVRQGCILSPCLFNFYAEYIMRNAGLEEARAGIKIARRNINNPVVRMIPPLWQRVKRN